VQIAIERTHYEKPDDEDVPPELVIALGICAMIVIVLVNLLIVLHV
jgi:hypothetical protein